MLKTLPYTFNAEEIATLVDHLAEIRSGGPLLFLIESNIRRAYSPELHGEGTPEEILILNNPSWILNLIAESNGSNVRSVLIAAPPTLSHIEELQKCSIPGDFIAFQRDNSLGNDYETQKLQLLAVATASKSAKGVRPIFLTNYTASLAANGNRSDQSYINELKSANDALRVTANEHEVLLCDVEYSFASTNRSLAPWGASLVQSDDFSPNIFGNICLAIMLYRAVVQDVNPDLTKLGELLRRAWFYIRGVNNLPWHFRADKILTILANNGGQVSTDTHINNSVAGNRKHEFGNALTLLRPDAIQLIQCVPMSRNGVHLLMGILSHLGAFCHFGKLEAHYENREGYLCLNDVGRKFVTTFATDMSLYDNRLEAEIPLRVEFSHRLNNSLFNEKWIRCVRDPRDMLVSIHDLAPVKKLNAKTAPIEETLEVPLPDGGGCIFGLGPIEEWALQESFLHHVIKEGQFCHVRFEHLKSDGVTEISRLLQFIGLNAEQKSIEEALIANKAEAVRPFGKLSQSGGKAGHWRSREFAALLEQRYGLVAQVLDYSHDYSFEATEPKQISWPCNAFTTARDSWVVMTLHNLKKRFPSARYDLFREPLVSFAQLAENLPMLEVQLAEALLTTSKHVCHAKEILERWANNTLWAPRFMALMALAKHDTEFKQRLKNSLCEAQSVWQRTKHPLIRQMASRIGFVDEYILSA